MSNGSIRPDEVTDVLRRELGGFETEAAACLLVGLSIEHVLQGSDLRPDPEGTSRPAPAPAQ